MQFILKLFKEIISALSKIYTKAEVDSVLETKLDVSEFEEAVETETSAMYEAYEEQVGGYEALDARSKALANIAKWRSYASAMQSMVDEETAAQIAEEFEKATVEYLKDPTATKSWITRKGADGNITSTCPYYESPPDSAALIDFNIKDIFGYFTSSSDNAPCFSTKFKSAVFLPTATSAQSAFFNSKDFNLPVILPSVTWATHTFLNCTSFNSFVYMPKNTFSTYLFNNATSFNQPLSLPKSTNCSYMLYGAKSFNSELHLPLATSCPYMLYNATSFNQPLSLPKSTSCISLLSGATVFNQPLDLPKASDCASLLRNARAFDQPLNLPECTNAYFLLNTAVSFNNPVYLPKVNNAAGAFTNTKMSAENLAITFRSFPVFSAEGSSSARSTITILSTPGSAHTDTTESFTVTDDDGMEYTMDNCPVFTNDDENQTLRKEFVLITVKKGWTVEL